jgi:hypothetical protein
MTSPIGQKPFDIETMAPAVIYANTEQELIIVTKDKLQLCLQGTMERMALRDRWMIPLGVLVPLVLALVTTQFTERFRVSGGAWETVFVMLTLFTLLWLGYALRQRGKSITVEVIMEDLAKNPVNLGKSASVEVLDPNQISQITETPISAPAAEASSEGPGSRLILPSESQPEDSNRGSTQTADGGDHANKSTLNEPLVDMFTLMLNGKKMAGSQVGAPVKVGDKIVHDAYGEGVILSVEGRMDDPEAKVKFDTVGVKHLVLRYAPIRKVD